jgi:hypothetical protein
LIPLWGTVLLPLCIAAMVKINDLVAGAAVRAAATGPGGAPGRRPMRPLRPFRTIGRAAVPGGAGADKVGRVYRSSPAETTTPTNETAEPTDASDSAESDQTTTAEHTGWSDGAPPAADAHRVIHGGPANRATAVNSPPVDLHQGKAARTATARDWAADVFDTPAQRARHAATRRYE